MSLFWITGSAGTGKSTVCSALKEKGYIAYDVDNDGLARWTNLENGFVHPKSSVKKEHRTAEFIKTHGWFVPKSTIEAINKESDGKLGFICGALDNYEESKDLFNGIIALYVDEDTIKDRFSSRSSREWGTQAHEVKQTIDRHQTIYDTWKSMGAIIVNSSLPMDEEIDQILQAASSLLSHF